MESTRRSNTAMIANNIFQGGLKGVQSAIVGGVAFAVVSSLAQAVENIWFSETQNMISEYRWLDFFLLIVLYGLIGAIVSFLPAFIGGYTLAYRYHHFSSVNNPGRERDNRLGILFGCVSGFGICLIFIMIDLKLSQTIHGGAFYEGPDYFRYLFFLAIVVIIAAFAGRWTEKQIKEQMTLPSSL